jgi:hypothetical protein
MCCGVISLLGCGEQGVEEVWKGVQTLGHWVCVTFGFVVPVRGVKCITGVCLGSSCHLWCCPTTTRSPRSDPFGVKHMWDQSQAWVRHEDDARGSGECIHETWYAARLPRGCTVVWRCECLCERLRRWVV